jgi:5'-deoxynucleotidase YfbR-like HD superfamily hydrolase
MRLQKHLEESYAQDLKFAKKRLIMFIDDIEHNINIMRKAEIKDDGQTKSLEKIYKEIDQKTKEAKATIKNAKLEEMFEPDVMSKNVIRIQIKSIERNLQTLDNRLNKGFLGDTKIVNKLRKSLLSVWHKLQGIYKIIGKRT